MSEIASAPATVIAGVSLATGERALAGDSFDLALKADGIEIRRPGQVTRQLSWEDVTEWELQDRRGGVLLTLRGRGAVTPLAVPHWTVDELESVLRDVMTRVSASPARDVPAVAVPAPVDVATAAMTLEASAVEAAVAEASALETPAVEAPAAVVPRQERRRGRQRWRLAPWRVVVTVALLGVLATAVTLVLLQSAGVIDLGFLGPTA